MSFDIHMSNRQRRNMQEALTYIGGLAEWYGVMDERATELRRVEVQEDGA